MARAHPYVYCGSRVDELPEPSFLQVLTPRERDVLALMAQGRTNPAIAQRLCTTKKTVECHVRSIFSKLDLPASGGIDRRVLAVLTFVRATQPGGWPERSGRALMRAGRGLGFPGAVAPGGGCSQRGRAPAYSGRHGLHH